MLKPGRPRVVATAARNEHSNDQPAMEQIVFIAVGVGECDSPLHNAIRCPISPIPIAPVSSARSSFTSSAI
jgi:hypothetical protein